MIEIGKVVVQIGFWSLISGPPDVRLFELHDATALLEQGPDGKGNWIMGPPEAEDEEAEEEEEEDGAAQVPVVIRSAHLNNVRVIYREAKKHDLVAQLDKLSISPGAEELLALEGHGKLDEYPVELKGELGPLKALLSARDMRIAVRGTLGKASLDIKGSVGSLEPLDGVDLTVGVNHPELERMLKKLELPVVATGPLRIDLRMKDAGELTRLDFDAKGADFTTSVKGTLKTLSLVGADLTLKVDQTDVGIMLEGAGTSPRRHRADANRHTYKGCRASAGSWTSRQKSAISQPACRARSRRAAWSAPISSSKPPPRTRHVLPVCSKSAVCRRRRSRSPGTRSYSRKQIKFDALTAVIADASVRADGTKDLTGQQKIALKFAVEAASLAKLKETWPADQGHGQRRCRAHQRTHRIEGSASGSGRESVGRFVVVDQRSQTSRGAVVVAAPGPHAVLPGGQASRSRGRRPSHPRRRKNPSSRRRSSCSTRSRCLSRRLKDIDAKVHLTLGEVVLGDRSIKDLDSNVSVDHGKVTFDLRAAGAHEGTLKGAGTLVPADDGTGESRSENRHRRVAREPGEAKTSHVRMCRRSAWR